MFTQIDKNTFDAHVAKIGEEITSLYPIVSGQIGMSCAYDARAGEVGTPEVLLRIRLELENHEFDCAGQFPFDIEGDYIDLFYAATRYQSPLDVIAFVNKEFMRHDEAHLMQRSRAS